ncbi:LppX_LprAFG lipoprotein [Micromonospora globbae]|uniref:LppX_LprAFG lipoprotein n=1 Tax=Micromonospora globbae TaxID=1894969 RepID=A0A420F2V5_9ACTN|nr:LppX_LprAFG lipoprotein [Micromonospora globbae]RKF27335.1 LppX_LprAFG lipoprotein [Micromonospora globbae]WTF86574.1 LppX_LprAFG lipoprotein [Micromonospora globbae]
MSLWKKTTVVAVSAFTALAVSACGAKPGSSEEPKQPTVLELLASDLKGSLQKTVDATDKSDSVTVAMEGTAAGQKLSMQGVLDLRDPVKAEMKTTGPDGSPVTVRMIGAVVYVEIPEADRASIGGKRWIKLDVAAAGAPMGMDFSKQFEDVDPTKQVKTLLATEGVTVVGEETVNGARTVHYTVTAPVANYLGQVDAEMRAQVEQELTKQGVKEVTLDLWVDEQYRPRRVHMVMGTMSDMTMDYTDYGKPVTIETPPAGETTDLADMLKGLGDLAAGN